ncbi:MAG: hypothetical protein Q8P68_03500 [Candidatus Peregrinibacteria bacterium]|nr:hypothetical protein [Candidatus Peregrinibacteria bacterium]MDZ4245334.1 hypothetical protein [Candidatus Gracilibacteria bacterium]
MKAEELNTFYNKIFGIKELQNYFTESAASIRTQVSRLQKSKKLIRLKRDCYTFPEFHPNTLVIGNKMVSPSYHSLESVLSMNGIIPESVTAHTLVTSKKTQEYKNDFGTFSYRHLPPRLFFGVEQGSSGEWVAEKEKALLDYLYLNSSKFKPENTCWQAERFDELDTLDFELMESWAKKYGMRKLENLVESLRTYLNSDEYQAHR